MKEMDMGKTRSELVSRLLIFGSIETTIEQDEEFFVPLSETERFEVTVETVETTTSASA